MSAAACALRGARPGSRIATGELTELMGDDTQPLGSRRRRTLDCVTIHASPPRLVASSVGHSRNGHGSVPSATERRMQFASHFPGTQRYPARVTAANDRAVDSPVCSSSRQLVTTDAHNDAAAWPRGRLLFSDQRRTNEISRLLRAIRAARDAAETPPGSPGRALVARKLMAVSC
jgi:hypothetical protein